ncbi:MAG: glycosyltransferase family 2 protein, partial [Planktomarina sp.]
MNITVVTTMRNEGPFVLEWLAHLRAIGVGHVVVYTNDCEDGTDTLLDTVQQLGWLTHIRQDLAPKDSPQWVALRAAWSLDQVRDADWVMICDVDEFPDIKVAGGTLPDLITSVGECDAIALPWRLFGNSGQVTFEDLPVAQQFTQCAIPDLSFPIATTFVKTIFRVKGPFSGLGVHRPKQKNAQRHGVPVWKAANGDHLPDHFANVPKRLSLLGMETGRDSADLRHYSLKSVEAFLVKHARGLPNRASKPLDLTYWINRNFNGETVEPLPT